MVNDIRWHEIRQNSWRKVFRLQCCCLCYLTLALAGLGWGLCFSFDRNYVPLEEWWKQLLHTQAVPGCLLQLQRNKLQLADALNNMFPLEVALWMHPLVLGVLRVWGRGWYIRDFPGNQALWHLRARSGINPCLSYSGLFHLTLLVLYGTPCFCQPNSDWLCWDHDLTKGSAPAVSWWVFWFYFSFFEGRGFCFCFSKLGESLTWSAAQPTDLSA